jgi:hypothetical protein
VSKHPSSLRSRVVPTRELFIPPVALNAVAVQFTLILPFTRTIPNSVEPCLGIHLKVWLFHRELFFLCFVLISQRMKVLIIFSYSARFSSLPVHRLGVYSNWNTKNLLTIFTSTWPLFSPLYTLWLQLYYKVRIWYGNKSHLHLIELRLVMLHFVILTYVIVLLKLKRMLMR